MEIGGVYILTEDQEKMWIKEYPDEYAKFVDEGFYNPDTNELFEAPSWMTDGNPETGPFDFALAPSHNTIGW